MHAFELREYVQSHMQVQHLSVYCELLIFRTSELLAVILVEGALLLCGEPGALRDLASALASRVAKANDPHAEVRLEFGDPNGLGDWPLGAIRVHTLASSSWLC